MHCIHNQLYRNVKKGKGHTKIILENISKMLIKQKKFSTYFTYREVASTVSPQMEKIQKLTMFC